MSRDLKTSRLGLKIWTSSLGL